MKQVKDGSDAVIHHSPRSMERRHSSRLAVTFGLMYSVISANGAMMGDGTVVNISQHGLGIHGNHPVKIGMELSMLLYLPDGDDPLFVLEAAVVWVSGNRFGVEFKKVNLRESNRLRSFLQARSASMTAPVGH